MTCASVLNPLLEARDEQERLQREARAEYERERAISASNADGARGVSVAPDAPAPSAQVGGNTWQTNRPSG